MTKTLETKTPEAVKSEITNFVIPHASVKAQTANKSILVLVAGKAGIWLSSAFIFKGFEDETLHVGIGDKMEYSFTTDITNKDTPLQKIKGADLIAEMKQYFKEVPKKQGLDLSVYK